MVQRVPVYFRGRQTAACKGCRFMLSCMQKIRCFPAIIGIRVMKIEEGKMFRSADDHTCDRCSDCDRRLV